MPKHPGTGRSAWDSIRTGTSAGRPRRRRPGSCGPGSGWSRRSGCPELPATATEAKKNAHREVKKKDCKALFYLHQCVDEANFEKISFATSAKAAWDILA